MFFSRKTVQGDEGKDYVFLAGLHRSGTSMLHRMLSDHPDVTGFADTGVPEDEGQHLQSVFNAANKHGGPGKFCFDDAAFMDETHPLVTDKNRKKLRQEWQKYWSDAPVRIEKSPPNIIRSRFLQAMFPQSRFIFITRHPIAVSMATQKWSHNSEYDLLRHWQIAHQTMLADIPKLEHVHLLRYEDLVARPHEVMKEIYAFLSLPPKEVDYPIKTDVNVHYYEMWQEKTKEDADLQQKYSEFGCFEQFGYHFDAPYVSPVAIESLAK